MKLMEGGIFRRLAVYGKISRLFFVLALVLLALTRQAGAASRPQRIISLGPIITENLYVLGAEERLVANTSYCIRPEAAREKEKIGSVMELSIEKIMSLRPDLVLATGLTQRHYVEKLQSLDIRVVRFPQPDSFAAICAQFMELGRLLGLEDKAQVIVAREKERVAAISKSTAGRQRPRVFLQIGSQPLFGAAGDSFTSDYIRLAGGDNVLDGQKSGMTSYEQVLAANPHVIAIAIMGSETGASAEEKKKWQRLPAISAVRDKQVVVVDPDLVCSPSVASFGQALELLAHIFHHGPEGSSQKSP